MRRIQALVGVYNAEGSVLGEIRYLAGKLTGTAHCALCDISHGLTGERRVFKTIRARTALQMLHLDEQWPALQAFTAGRTPCVVAQVEDELVEVLSSAALDACGASPEAFEAALEAGLRTQALVVSVPA
jgi:hypothetical protein